MPLNDQRVKQLDQFLSRFFPSETEPISIRALPAKDDKATQAAGKITLTREDLRRDVEVMRELCVLNQTRGMYFCPNSGGHSDSEIVRFNALFIERDKGTFANQHKMLDPYSPHIRVDTLKSVHSYWLIQPGGLNTAAWKHLQNELIARFKSDPTISNPSRLMRLPYFNYVIWSPINGGTYSYLPLMNVAYDDTHLPIGSLIDFERVFDSQTGKVNAAILGGIKEEFDPNQVVEDGEGRDPALFRFVRILCAKSTPVEAIWIAAREYNKVRISPSIEDARFEVVVNRALSYG